VARENPLAELEAATLDSSTLVHWEDPDLPGVLLGLVKDTAGWSYGCEGKSLEDLVAYAELNYPSVRQSHVIALRAVIRDEPDPNGTPP
jgi:hypothetical protein